MGLGVVGSGVGLVVWLLGWGDLFVFGGGGLVWLSVVLVGQ